MQIFNINADDINKLSFPKRKLLDKLTPILNIIDSNKLNQTLSKIEFRTEYGQQVFVVFIVLKGEQSSVIRISANVGDFRVLIDSDWDLFREDGAPDEALFSDKNIEDVCEDIKKLLKGFTIIESLTGKGKIKKKVFYWGIGKDREKIGTSFPTWSFFSITRSMRERTYVLT